MQNVRRFSSLLLLALIAAKAIYSSAHAQDARMCTEMWCDEGFVLELSAPHWQEGQYSIDMDVDGTVVSCTAQLPLPPCAQPAYNCSENALGVMVMTEGCALPASAQRLGGIRMQSVPKHFSAQVTLPDGSLRETAAAVEAQCGFPNGEQCDARACCSAKAALSLQ